MENLIIKLSHLSSKKMVIGYIKIIIYMYIYNISIYTLYIFYISYFNIAYKNFSEDMWLDRHISRI